MKKIIFFFFSILILSSKNLYAEWKYVTTVENQYTTTKFYIDPESLKKDNKYSYIWKLQDFNPDYQGMRSGVEYSQIDCNLKRSKKLKQIFYSGQMGKGDVLGYDQKNEWFYSPPNTPMYTIMTIVCDLY